MSDSVLLRDDQPVDPDDELLVAYLDDELDVEERKGVEKRLVAETEFQRRLQALQTGWEWLDELPVESNNEKLVESTIELLVSDILPHKKDEASWLRRNWKSVAFVSCIAASFAVGAIGAGVAKRDALKRDLEELAIAEEHEAYKLGDNFSLFYQLAYNPRWQDMIKTMEQVGQREMAAPGIVAAIPLQDREKALQELPSETRQKLVGRWEAYKGYSEETKMELRRIAQEVSNANDSEKLLRTMKAASVWIEELSEELRDDLLSDDEAVRQKAIDLGIDITMNELARHSGRLISDKTSDTIYLWLQVLLKQRFESMPALAAVAEQFKSRLIEQGRDEQWAEVAMLRFMVESGDSRGRSPGFWNGGRSGSGFGGLGFSGFLRPPGPTRDGQPDTEEDARDPGRRPPPPMRIPTVSDQEYQEMFKELLDDQARADLLSLTSLSTELAGDVVAINETLRTWAIESIRRNSPTFDSNESTALDRYREREDRDILDLMPPEEIMNAIYLRPERQRGSR